MTCHSSAPTLLFSLLLALGAILPGCAAQEPQIAAPEVDCDDLGTRLSTSPLDEQAGRVVVQPLTARDLEDYDRDESLVLPSRPVGARMSFGAPVGWTRPWLERWVACYREDTRRRGSTDLLAHDASRIQVRSQGGAFVIDVVSLDRTLATQIQTEARGYAQR